MKTEAADTLVRKLSGDASQAHRLSHLVRLRVWPNRNRSTARANWSFRLRAVAYRVWVIRQRFRRAVERIWIVFAIAGLLLTDTHVMEQHSPLDVGNYVAATTCARQRSF